MTLNKSKKLVSSSLAQTVSAQLEKWGCLGAWERVWILIDLIQLDLKKQLTVSRLMTEHYRRLYVDTYVELGMLKFKLKGMPNEKL